MEEMGALIREMEMHCSAEEIKAFRRGLGYMLSGMQERITDPMYREHMDLIPKEIVYAPPPGPTLAERGLLWRICGSQQRAQIGAGIEPSKDAPIGCARDVSACESLTDPCVL
jgi:hypothetical protein